MAVRREEALTHDQTNSWSRNWLSHMEIHMTFDLVFLISLALAMLGVIGMFVEIPVATEYRVGFIVTAYVRTRPRTLGRSHFHFEALRQQFGVTCWP